MDLGLSPLANAYLKPEQLQEAESFYPLHAYVCEHCFLVQLEAGVSPKDMFSEYAYFSSYSDTWLRHAREYTDMVVERFGLNGKSRVVEIASNDGYLLQYFVDRGISALGIEPAANVAETAITKAIPTIVDFFGEALGRRLVAEGKQADLVIGNNVLAHVPDLNGFVNGLRMVLRPRGVITLEFPHLMRLMAENQYDTIYHEHLSYFSLTTVQKIFFNYGLVVFDVEELSTHGGSLRIYVRHTADICKPIGPRVMDLLTREKTAGLIHLATYLAFAEKIKKTKRRLLNFLDMAKRAGKSVAGYGAPAKGNTLLNYCGIRSDLVGYTVDISPHKQGLFLPGTHIPIYHPDKIKETKPDYLLILPWNLKDEIINQMVCVREWGGRFVVPIPEVTVL